MPSIRIGHTPDPDDAFMFYGLSSGRVKMMDNYSYGHVIEDIESLNKRALVGDLEITAISAHAYAYLKDKYFILSSGASMGLNYGPILVTRSRKSLDELRGGVVAVPGKYTTAALLLKMAIKGVETVEANFLSIPEMVKLANDLHAPEFRTDVRGRLKITPKQDLRKILGRSPDAGDAFVLACWEPLTARVEDAAKARTTTEHHDPQFDIQTYDPYTGGDVFR